MATNPKIPPQYEHPRLPTEPRSGAPWTLIGIIAAGALLVALILWLPRTPRQARPASAAEVPAQPTGSQIQFSHLTMSNAPVGDAFALQAQMANQGNSEITGVLVEAVFQGANGENLGAVRVPVLGVEGGSNTATQPLTNAPVKPSETRSVRMEFDHAPQGWNHELPQLTVVTVTAAGEAAGQSPLLKEQGNQASESGKKPQDSAASQPH